MEEVRRARSREYWYDEERENLTKHPSNEAERGLRWENITTLELDGSVAQFIVQKFHQSGRQGIKEGTWRKLS